VGAGVVQCNETLPTFLAAQRGRKATFVHIDSDLYSSASAVLTELLRGDRLHTPTLLVFDELINYLEYAQGELKALCELMAASGRSVRVLGTAASVVLADVEAIAKAMRSQDKGRETPHSGRYRQDAAFVLL
jgi:hypothetical protein